MTAVKRLEEARQALAAPAPLTRLMSEARSLPEPDLHRVLALARELRRDRIKK